MDKQTAKIIKPFVEKVRLQYKPSKIILFGSRATGESWKRSDYDFIVVSDNFEGMHWLERISELVSLWEPLSDIDILPYTSKEFEEKKQNSSTVRSALRTGIMV